MSFYTSLTGLKAAQFDLATISNNVANVNSTAFKKSRTNFGDIFAAAPMQTTTQVAGQGTRIIGIQQQFTQGTVETTDKTLDLAITGEAFFTTQTPAPALQIGYTRNGSFQLDENRFVTDTVGGRLQVFPVDANGVPTSTAPGSLSDLQIPLTKPGDPTIQLSSVGVSVEGLVTATFADSTTTMLGSIAGNDPPGASQDVWVLKVDSMGCVQPGCHIITGIESQVTNLTDALHVYPNPVASGGNVTVAITLPEGLRQQPLRLSLISADGRLVREEQLPAFLSSFSFPIPAFHSGLYMLHLSTPDTWLAATKLVVQ